MDKYIKIS